MSKNKKHILSIEDELNFDMIGICSHHSDYRLAWNLNETIGIRLTKIDGYIVSNKRGTITSNHSMYEFIDEENRLTYYMINTKANF